MIRLEVVAVRGCRDAAPIEWFTNAMLVGLIDNSPTGMK